MFADQPLPKGHEKDPKIEGDGPVLDVVEIVLDPLFQGGIASPAIDLSPPRQTCLDLVAEHVIGNVVFKFLDQLGPFRPRSDETHLPLQDIEELRQFIQARLSKDLSDRGPTGIIGLCPDRTRLPFGIRDHGTKLQHLKDLSVKSHPFLVIENGAWRGHFDHEGDSRHRQAQHEKADRREDNVHRPLCNLSPSEERGILNVDDGKPIEFVHPSSQRDEVIEVAHHFDVDQLISKGGQDVFDLPMEMERESDEDLIDPSLFRSTS